MKGPPGYDIGDRNCLSMLKCIYGLVQAPRQYYMLCREVYQKAGMKHLQTDECVFTRYVYNSIGQPSLATGLQPCSHWFSTLPQLVLDLAATGFQPSLATGFQPCSHWFSTLPQLVLDLAATGFRPCRNWFSTLQQLVFKLAATGFRSCSNWFSTLQQLVFNLAATGFRPCRH